MIVGNGLVASAFAPYFINDANIVIFASGVSNSQETREHEFLREKDILSHHLERKKFIVYFSTCSIDDPELSNTPYVIHKKAMEALVSSSDNFSIFRLPQLVGSAANAHTLTNYLYQQIKTESSFKVWLHAKRNLIDIDDVVTIIRYILNAKLSHCLVKNIASPFPISILDLVGIFESTLNKKAHYAVIDAGGSYLIDSIITTQVADLCGVKFDDKYVEKLIKKYYGK